MPIAAEQGAWCGQVAVVNLADPAPEECDRCDAKEGELHAQVRRVDLLAIPAQITRSRGWCRMEVVFESRARAGAGLVLLQMIQLMHYAHQQKMKTTPPAKPRTRHRGGRNAAASMTAVEIFMPMGTCPCSSACTQNQSLRAQAVPQSCKTVPPGAVADQNHAS